MANGNIILTVPKNKKVQILGTSGNWYRVKYGSKTGYMKSGFFKNETSTSTVTEKVKVNLRLRSSRSTSSTSNVIDVIPKGSKVTLMKEYKDNWYQVRYDGQVGYVKGGYFATDSGTTTAADSGSTSSSSSSSWSMKTTANLRLRASRSTSSTSNVMDVIPKNTKVTVLNEYDGWYKVKFDGQTGYCDADYLT